MKCKICGHETEDPNKCPNCGKEFTGNICDNSNCDDPWTIDNIRSLDKAIESARKYPSILWKRLKPS